MPRVRWLNYDYFGLLTVRDSRKAEGGWLVVVVLWKSLGSFSYGISAVFCWIRVTVKRSITKAAKYSAQKTRPTFQKTMVTWL